MTTLYFHGLPGSAAELAGFGEGIAGPVRHFHVVERSDRLARGAASTYFKRLAEQVESAHPAGPLRLVGFSLGAAAALRLVPLLAGRIEQIELVSPAAPLGLGVFLDRMAGAVVFRSALAGQIPFALFTFMQAQAVRLAAGRMAGTLMAQAAGADRELAKEALFRAMLARSLRHSLLVQRRAYVQEIRLYVEDWTDALCRVEQPVTIWQGSEDNWTPPEMALALAEALPNCRQVLMQPGLSHFSTLRHYLSRAGGNTG